ncbi:YrrS family protein [Sporosarcina koreensis]|uniref:YrrS family protein n=1 Tax=Sporosarcina koreensis TaxID=334735 RepID=UPI00058F6924|nr:YrrS family protein [Sporosarcina koreensis]
MSEQKPEFSRVRRKRQNSKANKMLNWMIAIVVLLIVLVGVKIITGGNAPDDNQAAVTDDSPEENTVLDDQDGLAESDSGETDDGDEETADNQEEGSDTAEGTVKDESEDGEQDAESSKDEKHEGTVTYSASEDAVVDETMTNTSWEPIGTSQTGNHVSRYDGSSADWKEKQKALAYATGVPESDLIFWKIKNGGSPQKSIGIVSTKDKSKKYRVYLEWVDGEGWKPTQMDILNTLDFNY